MNEVKSPEIVTQRHRITDLEADAVGLDTLGLANRERLSPVHLAVAGVGDRIALLHLISDVDETRGKIDPDHFVGNAGKLK